MESHDNLYYEKLDLEPFTFSIPNAIGWNDIEYKHLLVEQKQEDNTEQAMSSPQNEMFVELFTKDVEEEHELSKEESADEGANLPSYILQEDWRRPLEQQTPTIDRSSFEHQPSLPSIEPSERKDEPHYVDWLKQLHTLHTSKTTDIKQNNEAIQPTVAESDDSASSLQTTKQAKHTPNMESLLASFLSLQTGQSVPTKTNRKRAKRNEPLLQLIHQLNKQTVTKLQNRS